MLPKVGEKVVVTFHAVKFGPCGPVEGEVVATPQWVNDRNCFALVVPNSEVPLRVININHVLSINGKSTAAPKAQDIKVYVVSGSKGDQYAVTHEKNKWYCTCQGFAFRKTCKHIAQAQEQAK